YEPVIGLETHVELGTRTKMFCGCTTGFGAEPNTQVCPVCLGLPGSLPVVNRMAIEYTIRIGLALNCQIASWCRFARKNYFYPDMPKNFQISQYDEPLCTNGYLDVDVDGRTIRVGIERVHLEPVQGRGPGLPVLPRAGPGAGRSAGRVGGADPRRPARGPGQGPRPAAYRMERVRAGDGRHRQRRRARSRRGDGRGGCLPG